MNRFDEKTEFDKERRVAPRHKINLTAPVLITAINDSAAEQEQYLVLQGQTLDVSISGLALIISNNDCRELKQMGNDCILHLLLPLPSEAIELEVKPVRYQRLGESETNQVLLGTRIINMNGRDRILFMKFINDCEIVKD